MTDRVILFDVIETLFSLRPLKDRFEALGVPPETADLFFAQLLRDAFALSAAGEFRPFPEIARGTLEVLLESQGVAATEETVSKVLSVFGALPAHSDVQPALEQAHRSGARVVLLTNGSRSNTEQLVADAGLSRLVDDVISVEDIQLWKPQPGLYREACARCGVAPEHATLVAAHAWDVHGAKRAGLHGVWVRRQDHHYHPAMGEPLGLAASLPEAVDLVLSHPA